jgi:ribosomal protein S18 acetylase RimI-like enzyme
MDGQVSLTVIRPACADDAPVIAAIRARSWRAAYAGVIPDDILAAATSPESVALRAEAIRRRGGTGIIIAESGEHRAIGFANFGPERGSDGRQGPAPSPGDEQVRGELYAIYVLPECWSTGVGRALMDAVLAEARRAGYACISLGVLRDNPRARRFYERAGFSPSGDAVVLGDLGGVIEIRYQQRLR